MGTHQAMALTDSDGSHTCTERTIQLEKGITDFLRDLSVSMQDLSHLALTGEFGGGDFEQGAEREHEQVYFLHINWQEKYIGVSESVFTETPDTGDSVSDFIQWWHNYISWLPGDWVVKFEYDCPHEMERQAKEEEGEHVRDDQ